MNKLVSRNPVLRFKLGRKIVKADWGWKSIYISDGKIDVNKVLRGKAQEGRIGMNGKPIIDNYYIQKPTEQQKTSPTDYSWMTKGTRQNTLEQLKKVDTEALRLKNLQKNINTKLISKNNTPPVRSIIDNKYLKGYEGMQQEIAGLGGVRKVLEMLGFTKDNGLDGIWGENTQKAFDAWKAKQQNDYILQLILNNIPLLPVDLSNSAALPTIQEQMSALTNNFTLTPQTTIKQPLPSLNRSDTRWVINDALGKNAYNYTGSLRKALRLYLNGEKYNANDLAAFGNLDIFNAYKPGFYKQGGPLLPSRNPVLRFKQRNIKL